MSVNPVLKTCISCGSRRVQRQEVSVRRRNGFTVDGVVADVCAACGARYFDLTAMEKLEAAARSGQ